VIKDANIERCKVPPLLIVNKACHVYSGKEVLLIAGKLGSLSSAY